MSELQGRRLPDGTWPDWCPLPIDDVREGDIWRVVGHPDQPRADAEPGNLTNGVWMFRGPDGSGFGTLVLHTVREHDDGTVSVRPGDGSSNSIGQGSASGLAHWHGYVEHCVWTSV